MSAPSPSPAPATATTSNAKPPRTFTGCSPISRYITLHKIGEGTFGEVFRALDQQTRRTVAIKRLVHPSETLKDPEARKKAEQEGIPLIALREIKVLKSLRHPNIVPLLDIAIAREGDARAKIYFVMPCLDHDLAGMMENPRMQFTPGVVKCLLQQMLEGLHYLHMNNIMHRDMKPANLLIGSDGVLCITDFGLARPRDPNREGRYTPDVVTRWYRPPEVCMGARDYTTKADIWGVGCIFAEMFRRKPILMGTSELDQLMKVIDLVGLPTDDNFPGWDKYTGIAGIKGLRFGRNKVRKVFGE